MDKEWRVCERRGEGEPRDTEKEECVPVVCGSICERPGENGRRGEEKKGAREHGKRGKTGAP